MKRTKHSRLCNCPTCRANRVVKPGRRAVKGAVPMGQHFGYDSLAAEFARQHKADVRDERAADARDLAGLTPKERREFCHALYCGHFALFAVWPSLAPEADGRLHAHCPDCGTHVSRSQFPNVA